MSELDDTKALLAAAREELDRSKALRKAALLINPTFHSNRDGDVLNAAILYKKAFEDSVRRKCETWVLVDGKYVNKNDLGINRPYEIMKRTDD